MSLFEDNAYHWRETYFILFERKHRPSAAALRGALSELGSRLEFRGEQADPKGPFESLTVLAPSDAAGMDLTYISGEEVQEQIAELKKEFRGTKLTENEQAKFNYLLTCNARLDVYHFQHVDDAEDDDGLDPGSLLLVMGKLAKLCHGVSVDPQSGAIL
jgi:hypothetical protein